METLRKGQNDTNTLVPKEGQRKRLLRSSKVGIRCPSLGFNPNSELVTDEMLVEYLAGILADIFIAQKINGNK